MINYVFNLRKICCLFINFNNNYIFRTTINIFVNTLPSLIENNGYFNIMYLFAFIFTNIVHMLLLIYAKFKHI